MLLLDTLQLFSDHHRLINHSQRTIDFYEMWLTQFDRKLLIHDLQHISISDLRAFLLSLQQRNLSPTTRRGAAMTLKIFFKWSKTEGLLETNPAEHLELPRPQRRAPNVLTTSDILTLINDVQHNSRHAVRDTSLICFLVETGARRAEVLDLTPADIHIDDGYAVVVGKGYKQRWIFFGGATQKTLAEWLTVRPSDLHTTWGLTESGLREVLRRISARTGLHLTPHRFRRAAATLRARRGMTAPALQESFGWERLETANAYVVAAETQAQARASNPLDGVTIP